MSVPPPIAPALAPSDDDALRGAIEQALGIAPLVLVPLSPGASRGAFRVQDRDRVPRAFLKTDLGPALTVGIGASLADEARILRGAAANGLMVPPVLAELDPHGALLMGFVGGEARPEPGQAERAAPAYMAQIASLHALAPSCLGLETEATVTASLVADLDRYVGSARTHGLLADPLLALAAKILAATLPVSDRAPSCLHGDVGAGNFMVEDGRLVAVLDWELAHAGDPHEDLAWLWVRGAHTPFGDPARRIAEYVAAGGTVEPTRLPWHVAFVTFKSVCGLRRRLAGDAPDDGILPIFIAETAYSALLCVALARLAGVAIDLFAQEPVRVATPVGKLVALLRRRAGGDDREIAVIHDHLAALAGQAAWSEARLAARRRAEFGADDGTLEQRVDRAGPAQFGALLRTFADIEGARCMALPNARRRVQRALDIGFGAASCGVP